MCEAFATQCAQILPRGLRQNALTQAQLVLARSLARDLNRGDARKWKRGAVVVRRDELQQARHEQGGLARTCARIDDDVALAFTNGFQPFLVVDWFGFSHRRSLA